MYYQRFRGNGKYRSQSSKPGFAKYSKNEYFQSKKKLKARQCKNEGNCNTSVSA